MAADATGGSDYKVVPNQGSDLEQVIPQDERTGTLIFAGVLVVWGVFWVYMSSDLPSRQQTAHLSQGFLPITAGILLTVLSAVLFASTWFTKSRPAEELGKEPLFEPRAELRGAAVFGVLLIYAILGTQFKSYFQPLIILSTVPMAFTGVTLGLLITSL